MRAYKTSLTSVRPIVGHLVLLAGAVLASPLVVNADESTSADSAMLIGTRVIDLDGRIHQLGMTEELKPVVLVLLDTGCPIANRYAPELNEYQKRCRDSGVEFYGLLSDPLLTREDAVRFRDEYKLTYPVIWDSAGDLALRLKPTHFPECFVVSEDDRIVYRGRIDNRFAAIGRLRGKITEFELRDAIDAVSTGSTPSIAYQAPVGCVFESWTEQLPESLDFNRHIAPIVYANCTVCHRQGSVAPFSLENYQHTKRRAEMLAYVVEEKTMPPWSAEPGFGHFRQERFLSPRQIALLTAWADSKQAEGDAQNQVPPPKFPSGDWELGQPDIELVMPEPFTVPATGDDIYRYFVISNPFEEDVVLSAMDFLPGDASVVHHMNSFVDLAGRARRMDAQDEPPGFSVFGTGSFMEYDSSGAENGYALGGWVPGMGPYRLQEGYGVYIPEGGEIVIEIHYHLSGKEAVDQSRLGLYLAKKPVQKFLDGTVIGTQTIDIKPGDGTYDRYFYMDVPAAIDLVDVLPHMHYIGRSAKVVATLPGGEQRPIVNVTDWDFRWQSIYTLRQPMRLPAGSRIEAWFQFDNSADNPSNPAAKPGRVRWGWETGDEMAEVWLAYVPVDSDDSTQLYEAAGQAWYRSGTPDSAKPLDIVETVSRFSRLSLWSDEGESLLLQVAGSTNLEDTLSEIETRRKQRPKNVNLLVAQAAIIGMQLETVSDEDELTRLVIQTESLLDKAMALDEYSWDAWMTRGVFYAESGEREWEEAAVEMFTELLKGQEESESLPYYYKSYLELSRLYEKLGRRKQARAVLTHGLQQFPDHEVLKETLGNLK